MAPAGVNAVDDRVVFESHDRSFSVRDLIDAAYFRGEMAPVWTDFLRLVAVENQAEARDLEIDDDTVEAAAEQFRYLHDLITAEETERWLEERGLNLSDFSSYFVRHSWSDAVGEPKAEPIPYATAPEDLRALFTIELILCGELDRMAQRASWRVASDRAAGDAEIDATLITEEEKSFLERQGLAPAEKEDWLGKIERDEIWLREQLRMEAAYERDLGGLLTRDTRAREISALRLPLTLFEVETNEFDSLDAAREALLCVRQDGMTMEEVAAEGRYPYRHREILLEDVPEDLQQKFLSVTPGSVLEPIEHGDGFHLCRIMGKAEPDPEDATVKSRAEDRILERYFAELTAKHLQWKNILP